jgi:hypothetical protein
MGGAGADHPDLDAGFGAHGSVCGHRGVRRSGCSRWWCRSCRCFARRQRSGVIWCPQRISSRSRCGSNAFACCRRCGANGASCSRMGWAAVWFRSVSLLRRSATVSPPISSRTVHRRDPVVDAAGVPALDRAQLPAACRRCGAIGRQSSLCRLLTKQSELSLLCRAFGRQRTRFGAQLLRTKRSGDERLRSRNFGYLAEGPG